MKRTALLLILVPVIFASSCQSKISTVDLGEFNIHTTQQQKYLDSEAHSEIDADGTKNLDKPNPVTFTIDEYDNNSNYDVYYSYNYKFDDSRIEQEHHISFNNKKYR